MLFGLLGLMILFFAYLIYSTNYFNSTKKVFFFSTLIVGLIFCLIEAYLFYIGLQISMFPDGLEYNGNSFLKDDTIKAEYIGYQKAIYENIKLISSIIPVAIFFVLAIFGLFMISMFMKKYKIIKENDL